jgi:hypothetical protein
LHFGSYVDVLQGLPDGSINLWIVDSPYGNTDLAFDKQPVDWAGEFWPLVRRKSAPNAVVVAFACEVFTLELIASNREWYRYRMVWIKSRASRYPDKAWRPLAGHEDVVVFAPAPKAATFNPQKKAHVGPKKNCQRKANKTPHYNATRLATAYEDDGTRYPTTVLDYASIGTTAPHFNPTAKPVSMVQEFILTFTNRHDNVAEPFAGDAPAGHACQNTGRNYWGAEINLQQYEYSQAQLANKSPLFAPAPTPSERGSSQAG